MSLIRCVVLLIGFASSLSFVRAEAPAPEKQKIEALLAHVGGLSDAKFIRNGSDYDAKTAATFLKAKWERNDAKIHSAQDFIAKAATGSGTSGKPYLIRFKDGREVPCADHLKAELAKIEAAAQPKQ